MAQQQHRRVVFDGEASQQTNELPNLGTIDFASSEHVCRSVERH
jgi:hypothetical protein